MEEPRPLLWIGMRIRLRPRLVNRRDQDPGLFIDLEGARDAFLIDCGSLDPIPKAQLMRISHLFVTHTHIDHFCGFDRLLRHVLACETEIRVFGPPGITANVQGKLDGYTWNLIEEGGPTFVVKEIVGPIVRTTEFRCVRGFKPSGPTREDLVVDGVLVADGRVLVRHAVLDHKIPSMAYSVQEVPHATVHAGRIGELGLRPGPWITKLQQKALEGFEPEETLDVWGSPHPVARLVAELVTVEAGRKVCYVTDTIYGHETERRVAALVDGADVFYCESNYQEADAEKAASYYHLTASQAGRLARAGNVRKLILFHVSRKYMGDIRSSIREARQEFHRVE